MVNDNFNKFDAPNNDSDQVSALLSADVDHKSLSKPTTKTEDNCSFLDFNDSIDGDTSNYQTASSQSDTSYGANGDYSGADKDEEKKDRTPEKTPKDEGPAPTKKEGEVPAKVPALGADNKPSTAGDGKLLPERLTEEEAKNPDLRQFSRATLEAARKEINDLATDPKKAVIGAAKVNRVIAFGEKHVTPNPHREFGASIMADLQASGVTHLAIEVPVTSKDAIDKFWETGKIDKKDLPKDLQHDDFIKLITAARDAGIRPVPVDRARPDLEREINKIPLGGAQDGERMKLEDELARLGGSRDNHMAKSIKSLLDADKNNKVAFWVGSDHLADPEGKGQSDMAVEQLREKYGFSVAAFADEGSYYPDSTVVKLTKGLTKDVAIPMEKAKNLGGLTISGSNPDFARDHYKNYQNLIIYAQRPTK